MFQLLRTKMESIDPEGQVIWCRVDKVRSNMQILPISRALALT